MKTLIKLVVAALLVNACWRSGTVFWRYYKFKDGVEASVLFAGTSSEADIHKRVVEIANELDIPVDPDKIAVRKAEYHTLVDTAYSDRIEIVPNYFYPWQFELHLDVFTGR